jgi:3-oxoacyl-[acyl-carrier protein] reductase
LSEHYASLGYQVLGCSRKESDLDEPNYRHFVMDICDEAEVKKLFTEIRTTYGGLDALINNAAIGSMNHALLTPYGITRRILETNVLGTFLMCREGAKLMMKRKTGRIVNFGSIASPLKLEGEAVYAASKAAVVSLTQILAREYAEFGITVNAVGPTAVKTDLIAAVPEEKIQKLIGRQALRRYTEFADITNVIDFYLKPESGFITGQVLFLGGV